MKKQTNLLRKTHFLGSKVRSLRKRNGLTLVDLSTRCMQVDSGKAPSVSYLSLIESGKRVPSKDVLKLFGEIFQKKIEWFMDDQVEDDFSAMEENHGNLKSVQLEPNFLFSKKLLESSIPELLSQTGVSGRKFAHILIRSYQEMHQNQFPDLERAAEEVGKKKFPLTEKDLLKIAKNIGLKIHWFERKAFTTETESGRKLKSMFRSFFVSSSDVYINRQLKKNPSRLKYDLASHIAHKVLHNGDGLVSNQATGGELGGSPRPEIQSAESISPQEILLAWRDFECSFFAGALLCPKVPFRNFLNRHKYDVSCGEKVELTPAVIMRRMTVVSTYKYWHYFDSYPPQYLRAVYRGNGIPLPWGNMNLEIDPCQKWAVFRMLNETNVRKPITQLSLLVDGKFIRLYSCISIKTKDASGNSHILSTGIDLIPSLKHQGIDFENILIDLKEKLANGKIIILKGSDFGNQLLAISRILNIQWVADGLEYPITLICPRSSRCPRKNTCKNHKETPKRMSWVNEIRNSILEEIK
jgi:transcriptional regulator with XRE-family HTH domain